MRSIFMVVLLGLVGVMIIQPVAAQETLDLVTDYRNDMPANTFVEDICPFYILPPETEFETAECGYLIVPENRSDPNSANIQLLVMVIYSPNPNPAEPVIYLEGGPGGSAVASYEAWYASALRARHDLILIDQRGTGFSLPTLNCPELNEDFDDPEAVCADRLRSEGVDLSAYNSAENAADVATLIDALGIDQANLFGVSYGTRLALTIMRDHPDKVRSAIIDAVYPPEVEGYDEQGINGFSAFQALFDSCAADAQCNAAYPDLGDQFVSAANRLENEPFVFEDDFGDEYEFYGMDFINEVFGYMYDASWIPYLPALIAAANRGDIDAYAEIFPEFPEIEPSDAYLEALDAAFVDYLGFDDYNAMYDYIESISDEEYFAIEEAVLGYIDSDSEGMFATVECVEEAPFNSLDDYEALSGDLPTIINDTFFFGVQEFLNSCNTWDVAAASDIEDAPVTVAVPTLVMSGQFDPITPPVWGDVAAASLPTSYHFVFPGLGHGAVDVRDCPTQIALDFLATPDVEPDGSCIAGMGTPDFVVP